jgi:hypothetical protein
MGYAHPQGGCERPFQAISPRIRVFTSSTIHPLTG